MTLPHSGMTTKLNVAGAVLASVVVVAVITAVAIGRSTAPAEHDETPIPATDRRLTEAYAIAEAIPDVLAKIPCHCGCLHNRLAHSSNLDCFRTRHADRCWQCVAIAHDVNRLMKKGESFDRIKRYVGNVYTFDKSH